MKILVTGSTGFLGNELSRLILSDSFFKGYFIARKPLKKRKYYICKLENFKKLNKLLNKISPDVIVNLAAEVNFKKKTKKMYKVNSQAVELMAKYCLKENKHLVQASGTIVNGNHKTYSHKTKIQPVNEYGKSKLMAEKIINKYKFKKTILRFGGIYGKNGPQHLSLNKFIKNALEGKNIIFLGNPKSKRNYVYVNDAAKIILKVIKKKIYGTYYVGGEVQNFEQMLKKIKLIINKKSRIVFKFTNEKTFDQIIINSRIFKTSTFSNSLKKIL